MSGTIEGERAPPDVTIKRRRFTNFQTATATLLGTTILVAFVFWRVPVTKPEKEEKLGQSSIGQVANPEILKQANPVVAPLPAAFHPTPPAPPQAATFMPAPPLPPPHDDKREGMLSYAAAKPPAPPPDREERSREPDRAGYVNGGETTVAFKGATLPGAKAGAPIDTALKLMPGIYHCILDTAVSSDVPGPFQCHTSEAIKSPARVTLMEPGTIIIGDYKNDIQQGQSRIPSYAAVAYTPNGVPVPLNSPMADAMGRVGLNGYVDNHVGQRFGGAFLLLLTGGALSAAQAALSHGNGNTYLNLQGNGVGDVATESLRNTINIKPTVYKNPGEDIAFFITAPVDFSAAYSLRVAQ